MENVIESIGTNTCILILVVVSVILLIGLIICIAKMSSLQKKYKNFIVKLGNGKNLEEDLETYMYRVEKVENQNSAIIKHIEEMDNTIMNCTQKIGMVRYSAFQDTGSDLSFTLALLDQNNSGVVLNGIYSREMSNIYAKPIEKGKSSYTLSEEEVVAIEKAINSEGGIRI